MNLDVIVVSYNTSDLLKKCLSSIREKKWKNQIRIWVVDNGSVDQSVAMVKNIFPQINLIENKDNLGFAQANNQVIEKEKSDYFLLLNSDTIALDHCLDSMVDFISQNGYGIVSCRLVNPDSTFQPNAGQLPTGLALFFWLSGLDDLLLHFGWEVPSVHQKGLNFYQQPKEVGWVGGAAMLIDKKVINKIGGLDGKIHMYGEDVEYCLRAKKAGFKVGWTDTASIIHLGGGSSQNPQLKQWMGEFRGLIYIYQKNFGDLRTFCLKMLIYFFVILRITAFLLIGKISVSKTYVKVLFNI